MYESKQLFETSNPVRPSTKKPYRRFKAYKEWTMEEMYAYAESREDVVILDNGLIIAEGDFPSLPRKFYRRKTVKTEDLKRPTFKECKICSKQLRDPYWQRMHICRNCYKAGKHMTRLF